MQRNIDIYKNDVWCWSGKVESRSIRYYIVDSDCEAVLGEDIYKAINEALWGGKKRVDINGNIYTWSIWTMTTSKL